MLRGSKVRIKNTYVFSFMRGWEGIVVNRSFVVPALITICLLPQNNNTEESVEYFREEDLELVEGPVEV